jgi:hypothetical protein
MKRLWRLIFNGLTVVSLLTCLVEIGNATLSSPGLGKTPFHIRVSASNLLAGLFASTGIAILEDRSSCRAPRRPGACTLAVRS